MPRPFDSTLKHLLEAYPADWLRLLGVDPAGPVELIDADLATVAAEADKVFRIGGPDPWLLHLELQVSYHASLPDRMLLYNVLVFHRHGLPARSVVLLLRPKADGPRVTGLLSRSRPPAATYLEFRYETLRLWQLPVDRVLEAGIGALPLAPLAAGAAAGLEDVIARMDRRVRDGLESSEAADLWTATYVLMGLVYPKEIATALRERGKTMEESVTYQEILSKGEARGEASGEARGKAKGIVEGARRILLTYAAKRLGPPSPETLDRIEAIQDFDRLERLTERVAEAAGWEELLRGE